MFEQARRFWSGREDAVELPARIPARLKHIVVDGTLYRRINQRRDKLHGNHYVTHFRVRPTHVKKDDPDDYFGVINLGHVLVPQELVGKLAKVEIRIFDNGILPEKPTFLKEKDVLEHFKKKR